MKWNEDKRRSATISCSAGRNEQRKRQASVGAVEQVLRASIWFVSAWICMDASVRCKKVVHTDACGPVGFIAGFCQLVRFEIFNIVDVQGCCCTHVLL